MLAWQLGSHYNHNNTQGPKIKEIPNQKFFLIGFRPNGSKDFLFLKDGSKFTTTDLKKEAKKFLTIDSVKETALQYGEKFPIIIQAVIHYRELGIVTNAENTHDN